MAEIEIQEVLSFLSEWRTRKELEEKFHLSNTESFNLLRWLQNADFVESCKGNLEHIKRKNKLFLYKAKG